MRKFLCMGVLVVIFVIGGYFWFASPSVSGSVEGKDARVAKSQSKKCSCCAKLKDFERRFKARQSEKTRRAKAVD